MKIAYIGTYPPRECGIGTFTRDLLNSMLGDNADNREKNDGYVVALSDHNQSYLYPSEVKFTISQEQQHDYLEAANFINNNGTDLCILQHEFGIFGGRSGVYILPLLHRLKVPLIVTLHTILKTPSPNEKVILKEICKIAKGVVVMSNKAIEFLTTIYDVSEEKIHLIEHGVPDIYFDHDLSKKEFNLEDKKVLLTFGFLGRNKGIETVIKALPQVIKTHPDVLYLILGKTHPNVLRQSGQEYRNYLRLLVKKLNLSDHVLFLNEFARQNELFKYLAASDIYVTPYLSETQITSGTLSFALGVGCAVVSTPYWHATELLAENRGRLFDFNDHNKLAAILNELLDQPDVLARIQQNASEYGRNTTWPKTGNKYIKLAHQILEQPQKLIKKKRIPSIY